ncbi:MAG: glycosyltransferase family 9 protein [Thermoanaerobaculia bacterium]
MARIEAARICIVRLSAVGDTVHALALANGLRAGYPGARITWVLEKVPSEIVRNQESVDRLIVFDARSGIAEWNALRRELRAEKFDLVVVPQSSSKAALVAKLTGGRIRLGFDWQRSREIHSLAINRRIDPSPPVHAQDQYLQFLEWLGIPSEPRWDLRFTEEEEERAAHFERQAGGRPTLALVLASSHPEKDWPAESYAALADRASRKFGLRTVLVGGPSAREAALARAIVNAASSGPMVALDRPIRDTFLRLRTADVVVAPDTGPLHAAVAMNVPTIGLFGYTDPARTGPFRRFHDLLVDKYRLAGEEQQPLSRKTKPGRVGLITVGEVLEKVRLALDRYASERDPSGEVTGASCRIRLTGLDSSRRPASPAGGESHATHLSSTLDPLRLDSDRPLHLAGPDHRER